MKRKAIVLSAIALSASLLPFFSAPSAKAACVYSSDLDAAGHRCGGRASSVRPGGHEPPPQYTAPQPGYGSGDRYAVSCRVDYGANLRSSPRLTNNVMRNTGGISPLATVHSRQMSGSVSWAWTTVRLPDGNINAWVHGSQLLGCP